MKPIPALKLSGDIVKNWHDFLKNFKIFMGTDDFQKKSDTERLAIFLDSIGKEGYEIFETFNIPAKEVAGGCILNKLIHRFQEYLNAFTNIPLYNTCKFFTRVQQPDESFNAYLKEIEEIAKWCQFGPLTKKMVRDRIISGVSDLNLQYKFKTMKNPSLEEVIENCQELERAREKLNAIIGRGSFFYSPQEKLGNLSRSSNDNEVSTRSSLNGTRSSSSDDEDSEKEISEERRSKRVKVDISSSTDSGLDLKDSNGDNNNANKRIRKRFECHRCPKSFSNKSRFKKHLLNCRVRKNPKGSNGLQDGKHQEKNQNNDVKSKNPNSDVKISNDKTGSNGLQDGKHQEKNQNDDVKSKNQNSDLKISNGKTAEETSSDTSGETFLCKDCGMEFKHASSVKRHCQNSCKMRFKEKSEADDPEKLKEDKSQNPVVVCNDCGLSYTKISSLRRHESRCHIRIAKKNDPPFPDGKEVVVILKPQQIFECDDCDRTFTCPTSLKRHKERTCSKQTEEKDLISQLLKKAEVALSDVE